LIQVFTSTLHHSDTQMDYTLNNTGNERFTWTLQCSGRVLGSKSSAGVDTLLRLHKKKCKICYNIHYTCVDESHMRPLNVKGAGSLQQDKKRYEELTQKLGEFL